MEPAGVRTVGDETFDGDDQRGLELFMSAAPRP